MEQEDRNDGVFTLPSLPGVPKTPPEILRQMTESLNTDSLGKEEEDPGVPFIPLMPSIPTIPTIPDDQKFPDPDFVHQFPVPITPTPMKPVQKTPKGKKKREPEPLGPYGVPKLRLNGAILLKELIERMDAELLAVGEKSVSDNPIMFNTMLKKFLDIKEPPISLDTLENHWKNMNGLERQHVIGRLDTDRPWHTCQMIDRTKLRKGMPKLKQNCDSFWQVVSRVNYELGACGCDCVEKNPMVFVYMLQKLQDYFTMPVDFNDFHVFWLNLKAFQKGKVAALLNDAEPWID